MIMLDTVKTFSEFLDYLKTYQPNHKNGYIKLSDYKYLVAIEANGYTFEADGTMRNI